MVKTKTLPKKERRFSIPKVAQGFLLLCGSVALLISLLTFSEIDPTQNWMGLTGHVMSWFCLYVLGLSSFLIPCLAGWWGKRLLFKQPIAHPRLTLCYGLGLVFSSALLLVMITHHFPHLSSLFERWTHTDYYPKRSLYDPTKLRHYLGGVPLHRLYIDARMNFYHLLGGVGSFLIALTLFLTSLVLLTKTTLMLLMKKAWSALRATKEKKPKPEKIKIKLPRVKKEPRENPLDKALKIKIAEPKKAVLKEIPTKRDPNAKYHVPAASLLTDVKPADQSSLKSDLEHQAEVLEETLLSFGIEAKVGEIHCGPTITSFEVHPAVGVKVQKIKALEKDIALNMQATSIRIIAPIPGKAAVGIEVPNSHPQEVSFRELLENYISSKKKAHIPLLLGKMVNGDDLWADLTKMPHLIIAGATGSGKSVCINSIVMSIVMNAHPDEIKIVMVDPKKVELTAYTHLPHMLAPVITEPSGACAALNWLVKEMERRYEILRQLGIRNIQSFNARRANRELEEALELDIPEQMSFIVVIIDELADLMMVASSDIETPIARIAQMARAVGIHLILATQRPSREVITGLIKANFPCRIAFKVASRVNSQIIIDETGADSLLGNGDMLFLPPGSSNLIRAQGAFIRDDDINKTISEVCKQSPTNYLIPSFDNFREGEMSFGKGDGGKQDALYHEAKDLVLKTGNASATFLQRKLKVGYARAASLMDQLEAAGIVGPSKGAKPREIYYPSEE